MGVSPRLVVVVVAATLLPLAASELIELSYTFNDDAPTSPRLRQFKQELVRKGRNKINLWVELYDICTSEHAGTHIDAPRHNSENGWTLEAIPTSRLWRIPAVVVDVSKIIKEKRLKNYEVNQKGLDGLGSATRSWGKMVRNYWSYAGLDQNNNLNFPGIGKGGAEWLANHGKNNSHTIGIVGVGIDTLSLDKGQSVRMPAHAALFAGNIYGLENVANLDKLPTVGSYVTVMPLRIKGGTGAPARIIAEVGQGSSALASTLRPLLTGLLLPFILALRFLQDA
ncbi:hypothetical protein O3P69_004409 [Scylla paramamosain]|uniref:Cyclase n=1 Tax=Scylla paramamosain TaxID=85552 RepID=A0AAW0UBV7_SCYPA